MRWPLFYTAESFDNKSAVRAAPSRQADDFTAVAILVTAAAIGQAAISP